MVKIWQKCSNGAKFIIRPLPLAAKVIIRPLPLAIYRSRPRITTIGLLQRAIRKQPLQEMARAIFIVGQRNDRAIFMPPLWKRDFWLNFGNKGIDVFHLSNQCTLIAFKVTATQA